MARQRPRKSSSPRRGDTPAREAPRAAKAATKAAAKPARKAATKSARPTSKAAAKAAGKSAPAAAADTTAAAASAVVAPATRARTILYVHGIGNKPEPSILKCQWDHALFGFDLGERSRLSYWVNRGYYPRVEAGTCASGDLTTLEDQPTGEGLSVKQHLAEVPLEAEVEAVTGDPAARAALLRIAAELEQDAAARVDAYARRVASGQPLRAAGVGALAVEAKILPLPAVLRRWITRQLTRALLRDVNDFLFVAERGERMRESVRQRLRAGGGPFVIVAHSQGSMIAYAVLCEPEFRDLDVPLFITIGSPLGIAEVQDQLRRLTGLRTPAPVGRWMNVADPLDPVAFDKRLRSDFSANARGVRPEDDLEWNPDGPRHPHSGSGYLRTAPVRTAVRAAVDTSLFQPVAEFTIARDVVRDLENQPRETRHEVLIELADPGRGAAWTVDDARDEVVQRLETRATAASVSRDDLRIEALERYVAAELTREEAEWLAQQHGFTVRGVRRIWRNAVKRALLDVSSHTVQAPTAHLGYQALGRGVEWAVLDTGVNAAHPHFAEYGNIVAQYDCTKTGRLSEDGTAPDRHGHGTHVAGIIAGCGEIPSDGGAPRRLTGIAPAARLHVYKVLDDDGTGRDAWIIKALDHVAAVNRRAGGPRIQGVNLSLGGPFDQSTFGCGHSPLCRELRRLWQQGVVVVLAAGNEGFATLQTLEGTVDANMDLSIGDPANLEESIAVGSVHKSKPHTYGISYFSSRGPTADGRQKPDLVAPGEKILSCRHDAPAQGGVDAMYVEMSGTSMAAPHVSGIVAAFLSARTEFTGYPDRVKQLLLESCTDLGRDRPMQGAGLPNLTKMLLVT